MTFTNRDLTDQFISLSYQDVLQQYVNTGSLLYVLDGYGNVVFGIQTASLGNVVITSDMTSSMTVLSASYSQVIEIHTVSSSFASASISASYALNSTYSDTASYAVYADYAGTASVAIEAVTSSYAETASYLYGGGTIIGGLQFDTASAVSVNRAGYVFWDNDAMTLAIKPDLTGSTLQLGQEQWLRAYAGEYIANGSPVYVSASLNDLPIVKLALADGRVGSVRSEVVGVATDNITSGSIGIITTQGQIHDLNTSGFVAGQSVYLSHINSGSLVSDWPEQPFEIVRVGYILKSDAVSGILQVAATNMEQSTYPFVGIHIAPTITSGSGGQLFVGTGSVNFSETSNGFGPVKNYQLPSASFTLNTSSLACQYLVATYNSGSPIYQLATDHEAIDEIQTTLVNILVYRTIPGTTFSVISLDEPGNLLPNKILSRITDVHGTERESGLIIGVSGSRYCTLTEGRVWTGVDNPDLPALNSSSSRMILLANSASVFSSSYQSQLTNTLCDNGTNVVPLGSGNNHWVANYVYRGVGNQNTLIVMYSEDFSGTDGLINAQLGQPPATPEVMSDTTILVGRVIYQKGVAAPAKVQSAFFRSFTPAGITDHNELSNLQGGAAGEYYHLDSASYAQVASGTASYANQAATASVAHTASYALTASYAMNGGSGGGTGLATGSTYPITASHALTASYIANMPSGSTVSASYALTSSYAMNQGIGIPRYDFSYVEYQGPYSQFSKCTYRVGGVSGSIVCIVDAYYNGALFIGVSKSLG